MISGPLWEESNGHQWIPFTKASDAEVWGFLWCAPEQTAEQTVQIPVILWRHCNDIIKFLTWMSNHIHLNLSGGRLNKKDGLTRYGDSHVKDKTS